MEIPIAVDTKIMSLEKLKENLESHPTWDCNGLALKLRRPETRLRGADPTILVAIVGAAGANLAALIAGLLRVAKQTSSRKIIIKSPSGARLECPADMTSKDIDVLIEKLREFDRPEILLP